ncbi:Acyl transferase/acyl hydrolase/lysophospholipase [Ceratocystis lukuohia]|uniref:Acyl transferase/acyl hydrolase/lysophospholipase n=1 Tax=Ceratocystis lukuohia TaxID=2019550 RepID=A0ABR4MPY2_9PEZI
MSSPTAATEPCKILSLDGGGIRGLSSLFILEEIMEFIKDSEKLSEIPKPCERFDLIGGTGTGGIIAMMLGRLEMTVDQCIRTYKKLAETAFTPKRLKLILGSSDTLSATNLEDAVKRIIREHCVEPKQSCTKTAVLAMTKDNIETSPTLLTTYDTSSGFSGSKIWEVARATSATATLFKSIKIGRDETEFIDASFGHNNPCESLIVEAEKQFPGRPMIVLSIGTGLGDVVRVGNTKDSVIKAFKEMAVTSKATALRLQDKFDGTTGYYRFDVENGLKDVTLLDWRQASKVSSHTLNYLHENEASLMKFVKAMTEACIPKSLTLEATHQASAKSLQPGNHLSVHYIPYRENIYFVGQEDTLTMLSDKLFNQASFQEVVLVGMGGMGKTQIALKLAHSMKIKKPDYSVFWLTVVDMDIFHDSCKKLAEKLEIEDTKTNDPKMLVKRYLESEQSGKWLLILDNLDSIELFNAAETQNRIAHFFPHNDMGRILITTRSDQVAWSVVQDRADIIKLKEMSSEELTSILKLNMEGLEYESQLDDKALVNDLLEELSYLPLAISQASDYMLIHDVSISDYLGLLRTAESTKLRLLNKTHIDEAHYHHSQGAVTTTWIITFQQIHKVSESAAALLEAISHMSPKSIPQSSFPKFEEPEEIIEAIGILLGYGFLRRQKTPGLFDMHSLVHSITRLWYKKSLETDFF